MATPYQDPPLMTPYLNDGDEPFFEATAQGKLVLKHCKDCNKYHHYPRAYCPFCYSANTDWKEVKGTGTIYTFTVARKMGPIPYAPGLVTLDEGPSLITNIVDCDLDSIRCGQKVQVVFKATSDGTMKLPMFKPV